MVAALGLAGISTAFSLVKMLQRRSEDADKSQKTSVTNPFETGQNLPTGTTGPASLDPAALFKALDTNNSGGLDKAELQAGLQNARKGGSAGMTGGLDPRTFGALLSVQEANQRSQLADKLISKLDANGDKVISQDELASGLTGGKQVEAKKDGLDALFALIDKDKDGKISSQELKSAMENAQSGHHRHRHQDWTSLTSLASQSTGATASSSTTSITA